MIPIILAAMLALPDAPIAQTSLLRECAGSRNPLQRAYSRFRCTYTLTNPVTDGQFFDKPAKIAFAANMTMFSLDAAQTCHNLANGGHERFLPTQSCAGATAIMGAEMAGLWLGAHFAHRRGLHKLERVLEWTMPVVNTRAIIYSKEHGAL